MKHHNWQAPNYSNYPEEAKEHIANIIEASQDPTKKVTPNYSSSGSSSNFQPVALAMVRRTFPSLFANKITNVQPMSTPVGLAFASRIIWAPPFTYNYYGTKFKISRQFAVVSIKIAKSKKDAFLNLHHKCEDIRIFSKHVLGVLYERDCNSTLS